MPNAWGGEQDFLRQALHKRVCVCQAPEVHSVDRAGVQPLQDVCRQPDGSSGISVALARTVA